MPRIAEVALFTDDVQALAAFYERLLGRPPVAFALDQDDAAERARSGGAEVLGPKDFYWGRSAYLRDPDDRAVELQAES